jgi:hypothetical protein
MTILYSFGTLLPPFWYIVTRKIWQPCFSESRKKFVFVGPPSFSSNPFKSFSREAPHLALFSDTYDIEPEPGLPDFSGHKVPKYTRMAIKVPNGNNLCIPGLPDCSGHNIPEYTRMAIKVPKGHNICIPGLPDFSGYNKPK